MSRLVVGDGKQKIRLSQAKIKALKRKLRMAISAGHTLRDMATSPHFYNGAVTFQTLGRFVNEKDYVPAGLDVCKALDIIAEPNPYRSLPKWYKRVPEALQFFNTKREQIKQMNQEAKQQRYKNRMGV
jgi:hypothetical protein